jgi:hypothetical protein
MLVQIDDLLSLFTISNFDLFLSFLNIKLREYYNDDDTKIKFLIDCLTDIYIKYKAYDNLPQSIHRQNMKYLGLSQLQSMSLVSKELGNMHYE